MDRSPGFGSTPCDYAPYSDSVSLRLPYTVKLATNSKSLTHYTKGTQSPLRASTACTHTVSGSISLPSPGFFSPFPHGTGSLSVGQEYLALEDGPPMFRQGFTCPALLTFIAQPFRVPGYHLLWPDFPDRSTKTGATFGLVPVRSSLLRESRLISFPPGTEIFQFSGFASTCPMYSDQDTLAGGFPHSDIAGSKLVASSPTLFAGCHVLHRL
jgi:hypothetical protein